MGRTSASHVQTALSQWLVPRTALRWSALQAKNLTKQKRLQCAKSKLVQREAQWVQQAFASRAQQDTMHPLEQLSAIPAPLATIRFRLDQLPAVRAHQELMH